MKRPYPVRFLSMLLTLSLLLGLVWVAPATEAEAVSGINALSCSGFISNATARNYIDVMMRHYLNNNSKLRTALDNGKNVIFMFEGGSDNYWNGSDYTNSAYDTRDQAVVIVVQKNSAGNAYIDFYSENCSSIPGDPSWCTGAAYSGSVTVMDGIYPVYTTNHTGPYAALQLDMSATNGYGYYTPLSDPDGFQNGCSGINVHTRASDISAGSDLGWAWSEGCQVIGSGSTSSNVFNDFMQSVCGITWDPWIDYYASPKNLNSFSSSNLYKDVGYFVIDRQLGLTNAGGTEYGSGSLRALYNTTALTNITASSTSARANADFSTDYRDGCTFYRSHGTLKTLNPASVNSLPCAADTNGSQKLEQAAKGDTYTVTGLYLNQAGNYFYQLVTKAGKTGYIYAGSAEYTGTDPSDIKITGASTPNGHVKGNVFYVNGTVSAPTIEISDVEVWVRSGFNGAGTKVTGGSAAVSNNSYALAGSAIDNATAFNEISTGKYTYTIAASYKSYFVSADGQLMYAYGTKTLVSEYFVVIPSSVSQSSCAHSYSTTTLTAATCTAAGSQVKSCATCGVVTTSTVAAKGHSYGGWTTVEATCDTDGSRSRTCSACGHVDEQVITASGHDYTMEVKLPTCVSPAGFEYTCGNCGDHYIRTDVWLEEIPEGMDPALFESKIQYRYSDMETTTSYETSLAGYTQKGSTWEKSGSGSVSYVNAWSSGIDTGNACYTKYNKKSSKVTASETATTKTVIDSDAVSGYVYHHWCYSGSYYSLQATSGSYTTCHAFYSTTAPSSLSNYDASDGSYYFPNSAECSDSDWWWPSTVYTQKYTNYKKLFTYERWGDWSGWSDTEATASATRQVQTRTVYRLKADATGDHSWQDGVCVHCGTACAHSYSGGFCAVCGSKEPDRDLYLFGFINGANYACEEDAANIGIYKFVDGKLVVTFTERSYVAVKTGDNGKWYMTDGYPGDDATSAILYTTDITGERSDKLSVPKGRQITFTVVRNDDGTLTLSYEAAPCEHDWTDGVCGICDEVCRHVSWTGGVCGVCGVQCAHDWAEGVCGICALVCRHSWQDNVCAICAAPKPQKDYYLFGFINGADYGCEGDYERLGDYRFVDGSLTATFRQDSYVAVKSHDNNDWYMLTGWLGEEATSGTLINTNEGSYEKMYVPGGKQVTFTLVDNGDDTFELSFVAVDCPHTVHDQSGVCAACGQTVEHDWDTVTKEPSCTVPGSRVLTCKICHHVTSETLSATGHSYEAEVIRPTCSLAGYTTHTCAVCGDSYTDAQVPALGHSYSVTGTTAPGCTTAGNTVYGCAVCGHSYSETVAPVGHHYVAAVTPPTCAAQGHTTYTCPDCGDSYTGDLVAALPHSYETVVTDPTCTEEGRNTHTCTVCGHSYSDTLLPLGHTYVDGICILCGGKDMQDVTDPGLTLKYPTLSFEDEIFYNVYYTVADTSDVLEMGLMLLSSRDDSATMDDAIGTVPGYITNGTVYMVRSQSVPAARLGDTVYFKVYAKLIDGTYRYSAAGGYNAKAYANSILNGTGTNEMKSLVVAMLQYGAEAQKYFGYKTDKLVDAALTDAHRTLVQRYDEAMVDPVVAADSSMIGGFVRDNANFKSLYPSVSFDGAFAINFYCTPAITVDSGMTLYWWDEATYASIDRFTLGNATGKMVMTETNGQYWGEVAGIAAKEMDRTYYVSCVFKHEGAYTTTGIIPYSLGKYCESKAAASGDAQQAFAQATAVYGYYAKQYFAGIA